MEKVQPVAGLGKQKKDGEKNKWVDKKHVFSLFVFRFFFKDFIYVEYR